MPIKDMFGRGMDRACDDKSHMFPLKRSKHYVMTINLDAFILLLRISILLGSMFGSWFGREFSIKLIHYLIRNLIIYITIIKV